MGIPADDTAYELDRAQNLVELILAVVVPVILTLMLFSYVVFRELFDVFFILAIVVAFLTLLPAKKMHDLQFDCWSANNMPLKIVTSFVGMIYISVVAVFAVAMIAVFKGLTPEKPLTFGVVGGLLFILLGVMSYNSKYRDKYLSMEKRFFRKNPRYMEDVVIEFFDCKGENYMKFPDDKGSRLVVEGKKLAVNIVPLGSSNTEIIVEDIDLVNVDLFNSLKELLRAKV
ncbi:MAG: hypothetical protein ABSB83_05990 [Methanomassiliicoccales archaeon]